MLVCGNILVVSFCLEGYQKAFVNLSWYFLSYNHTTKACYPSEVLFRLLER
jgi:hypothetical protein